MLLTELLPELAADCTILTHVALKSAVNFALRNGGRVKEEVGLTAVAALAGLDCDDLAIVPLDGRGMNGSESRNYRGMLTTRLQSSWSDRYTALRLGFGCGLENKRCKSDATRSAHPLWALPVPVHSGHPSPAFC